MDLEERFNLIKRGTAEVITDTELRELLSSKQNPSVYIGRATTGPLHIGHIVALGKLLDFQKAGFNVIILLADIHAALDDLKAKWEDLDKRVEYTRKCIELSLPWYSNIKFVRGSDFQLREDYHKDLLKLSTITTVDRAMRAASEVTRMKNPKVSELIYPLMQALDEQYLGVDVQLGGTDQRHILALAREVLPEIGYKKRVEVMTPLIPSLLGPEVKMSSSISTSHIKVYESEESIRSKINKAYCPEGVIEGNFIIAICKYLIFSSQPNLLIKREEKFGGDITVNSEEELEELFSQKKIHPKDLKDAVAEYLINTFSKVRQYFNENKDMLKELGPEFMP